MAYSCHFTLLSGAFRSHLMVSAFAQDEAHALHAGSPAHSVLVSSLTG